ncbi:hypothetical protein AAH979_06370 [Plantactinospora sp. ZYX-F-223]|uniref:hypothetical protein n=1 Tax=Plantactinospora sp. ZYX-F-223 TaxID=3144103 RepID=UPI0031FCEC61
MTEAQWGDGMGARTLSTAVPVGAAAIRRAGELPARIFASAERWGWEFRPPGPVAVPPDLPQPVCHLPPPAWATDAVRARGRARTLRVLLGLAIGVLAISYVVAGFYTFARVSGALSVPDVPEPEKTRLEQAAGARYLEAHPFADEPLHYLSMGPDVVLGLLLAGVLLWLAVGPLARSRAAAGHRDWLGAVRDSLDRYEAEAGPWAARRRAAREEAEDQINGLPFWFPLGPHDDGRVDVYGGTPRGWCCLLLTMGASLVGAGARLSLLDLTREGVGRPLVLLAEAHNRSVRQLNLPADAPGLNLLAGLEGREVAELLVVAAHAAEPAASPERHTLDMRVVGQVCDILAPELTIARVCAGLRTLLRQEPFPGPGSVLTVDEYERLHEAFGEVSRKTLEDRIGAIEARLHPLLRFGAHSGAPVLDGTVEISVVEVDEAAGDLAAEMLAPLLLNVAAAHAQHGTGGAGGRRALVVAGADLVPRAQLERLDRIARRRDIRLVYLFRHVRQDAEQLLGSGGPVVLMRVGNAKEAEAATNFIGREHRFVVSQLTIAAGTGTSESTSTTRTHGTSRSETRSDSRTFGAGHGSRTSGRSVTEGTSESTSHGTSDGTSTSFNESVGRQRNYQLTVEPRQLQTLPETALFVVDPERREGPRARLGDCNPWIVTAGRVQDEPRRSLAG